jgi:hypothetical protein
MLIVVVVLVVDRANIQHFNPSHTASAKKLILICGLVAESKINKNKKSFLTWLLVVAPAGEPAPSSAHSAASQPWLEYATPNYGRIFRARAKLSFENNI